MRFLIKFMSIFLSILTFFWVFVWAVFDSMDQALLGQSASLPDTLKFFAVPAVGWILVIAAWVKTERPFDGGYEEDGVWVGNIYLPNRVDED
jgi:hypothetical protein